MGFVSKLGAGFPLARKKLVLMSCIRHQKTCFVMCLMIVCVRRICLQFVTEFNCMTLESRTCFLAFMCVLYHFSLLQTFLDC